MEAQIAILTKTALHNINTTLVQNHGRWCFTDGSWKDRAFFRDKVGILLY